MSKYNLNEKVGSDSFDVEMDGVVYKMAYPTSRDLLHIQGLADETTTYQDKIIEVTEQLQKTKDAAEREKLDKQLADLKEQSKATQQTFLGWSVNYITAPEGAPDFKETILDKNAKFLLAFIEIVRNELGE